MIRARIRKSFPARAESAPFTLEVDFSTSGGVTVLFGPSGAGKTLTLDIIAGFVRPDEGRVMLDDEILFDAATRVHLEPQARHCGYVFQNYALFPHMTLRENLTFAANCAARSRKPRMERHRKVNEMIERFHLEDSAGRKPSEVSGGQKQRCSIARALIGEPKVLLLDEPARGLDAPLRAELYAALRQVRAEFSTPVVLVTHDLEECLELGEEMLILRDGKLVQSGAPVRVLDQPANVEVARLMGLFNLIEAQITALDPANKTSRVKTADFELNGPYFPGRLRGDRIWLCVRPELLIARPRDGRTGPNQAGAQLIRVVDKPAGVRLEFSGGIFVDMPRPEFEPDRHNKEWIVEFPPHVLRAL
jgi:molybdate transport system ATP-binding protein